MHNPSFPIFQRKELRPELSIENIQMYHKKDFLLFLCEIIGLSREKDPKELIEERFDKYIYNFWTSL